MHRRVILRTAGLSVIGAVSGIVAFNHFQADQSSPIPAPEPPSALASNPELKPAPLQALTARRSPGAPDSPDSTGTDSATPVATPSAAAPVAATAPTPDPAPVVSPTVTAPSFSDVTARTPADGIKFLQGKLPAYTGSNAGSLLGFSSSDILETLDTGVVDRVNSNQGQAGLKRLYDTIAAQVLQTLSDLYGDSWVLVPLDAGHGGDRAEFWDSGSNGTEALHTRAVVASVIDLAKTKPYSRIIVVPIFNDEIPDYFDVPGKENEPLVNQTVMRQIRAAMLALEAARWNRAHPDPASRVVVHEISIHFNSGVGGALVLHQGDTVPQQFQQQSINYGKRYLQRVVPALNATGVLPSVLTLFGGSGLHDDVMMYTPGGQITDDAGRPIILRYGMLQGGGFETVYVQKILKYA
jgi:hypothetical protein